MYRQGADAVAIGENAGQNTQGIGAIAIGTNAGQNSQGTNAIAIGNNAGLTSQASNSIVLNASGIALSGTTVSAFYVNPIRSSASTLKTLMYDDTNKEVVYSASAKTFVIDHPVDKDKLLVHACLEGPEAGVYYRGKGEVVNNKSVVIHLPSYVGAFSTDLTVQITHIYDGKVKVFSASEVDVENNTFTVYGESGRFNWLVHGKRGSISIEPSKNSTTVKGDGPYKYVSN
jgi:hypothetical protein